MQDQPLAYGTSSDPTAHGDVAYQGLRLQCPSCRGDIAGAVCTQCQFRLLVNNGVVCALPPKRAEYYAQFTSDYEHIRAEEGRGSNDDDYYLGLPYKDATGRNSKQWKIRACSYDFLMRLLKAEQGYRRVLDLGAGNCWMSFRLLLAGYQPVAVDLLTNEYDGLAAAFHYQRRLLESLPTFQAELTNLPFQDEQFDAVIFNASFHYSEDYGATLGEALRCVRRGGIVIISDTPWYSSEEGGREMVAERHAAFCNRYGMASNSINSLEYLTDERLRTLEKRLSVQWTVHSPWYGLKWAMRPWIAKLNGRREPSRFRVYVTRKDV